MIRHLALATSLAALLAPGSAQAARDACPQAADIVRAAYPRAPSADNEGNIRLGQDNIVLRIADADYGEPFAVTCKTWPAKPDLLLAAIPLMQDTPNQDDGHQGDLRILVLDRATLKIRHDLRLEGVMSDDAVRLSDVSFDTARYDVTAGRRAFGLRISRVGASRANPFGETSLRLFDIGPKGLAMVLDGLIVHRSGGEWDTNCAGKFSSRAVTLSMADTVTHEYRDIITSESYESSRAAVVRGDCEEKVVDKGKTPRTLKFDGQRYQIPERLRSLDRDGAG
jgi:hypothetical protein